MAIKFLSVSLGAVLTVSTGAVAARAEESRPSAPTVSLTHIVTFDRLGRLKAFPGAYARVRETRDGAYYAPTLSQGAGALVGGNPPRVGDAPGRGVIAPPLARLAYLEVLADGLTLCGADADFVPMACTKNDNALARGAIPAG